MAAGLETPHLTLSSAQNVHQDGPDLVVIWFTFHGLHQNKVSAYVTGVRLLEGENLRWPLHLR